MFFVQLRIAPMKMPAGCFERVLLQGLGPECPWLVYAFFVTPRADLQGRAPTAAWHTANQELVRRIARDYHLGQWTCCETALPSLLSSPP
jgi:hypothetical protein